MRRTQSKNKVIEYVKKSYSDKSFFTSLSFFKKINNLAKMVTNRYRSNKHYKAIRANLYWNENDEGIACTDNNVININMNNQLIKNLNRVDRITAIIGLLADELGHCLYTDFLIGKNFALGNFDYSVLSKDAYEFMQTHKIMFFKFIKELQNILEDPYVEHRITKKYTGSFKRGINFIVSLLKEHILTRIENDEGDCFTFLLAQARQCLPESVINTYPCFKKTQKVFDSLYIEPFPDMTQRCVMTLEIFNIIFDTFIKDNYSSDEELLKMYEEMMKNNKDLTSDTNDNQNTRGIAIPVPQQSSSSDSSNDKTEETSSEGSQEGSFGDDNETNQNNQEDNSNGEQEDNSNKDEQDAPNTSNDSEYSDDIDDDTEDLEEGEKNGNSTEDDADYLTDDDSDDNSSGVEESDDLDGFDDTDETDTEESSNTSNDSVNSDEEDDVEDEAENSAEQEDSDDEEVENSKEDSDDTSENSNDSKDDETDADSDLENSDAEFESDAEESNDCKDAEENSSDNFDDCSNNNDSENDGEKPIVEDASDNQNYGEEAEQVDSEIDDEIDDGFDDISPQELIDSVAKEISENEDVIESYERHLINEEICSTDYHSGVKFTVKKIKNGNKTGYDYIMKDLRVISKSTLNKVRDAVLQKKRSLTQKRQPNGNRLDINAYAKRKNDEDFNVFINSKKPNKNPQMAVSVVVDGSGSMSSDNRVLFAKYAAIIIEDFCRNLNIPVSVISHRVCYEYKYGDWMNKGVEIEEFIEFDSPNPKKQRYNLTKFKSDGCNRDGFAIRYAFEKIKYRKEPFKILIVISDGAPNDANYGMEQAKRDIADIYRQCKKKNVELIAFAIGDDIEELIELYGSDNLVDCRDLNKFPKTVSTMLAQRSEKAYK